ncbi:MAG: hypothetical protein ACJ76F_07310 [Bacteroidia bacterium]
MKRLPHVLLLILIALTGKISAQDLDLKWSETQIYDNKADGFFDSYIDANSKYVYAKFHKNARSVKKEESKMKLVAFDKTTMKKAADGPLVGYPENAANKDQYKGLKYYKTIVFEDVVYVFWIKETKEKEELHVQSFDNKLKVKNKIKKIYEVSNNQSRRSRMAQSIFVLANDVNGEKLVIGAEQPTAAGQDAKFEYKVLNQDFSFAAANQVTLPITLSNKSFGLSSSYEFGDDGNLYVKSYVTMSKEERKNAKKGEATAYSILSVVDLNSGKITPYTMKFDNKNIFNFGYRVDKNVVKVYGFFCDLDKDPRGDDMHGIFYSLLDSKSMTMKDMNFAYFDKSTLDKLFAKDKEDQKKGGGVFKSKKSKQSDDESLDSRFEIESVQSVDDKNIVIFCSKMYNYSRRVCTSDGKGNTTCTTYYYCEKSNVTAFKLNNDGDIVWASNLDRKITYNTWYVYDLNVIHKGNKFYAIYGSSFQTKAAKKGFFTRKSGKQSFDKFEYAVFDYETGNYSKKEYTINPMNAKKADRKTITPSDITVIDNNFYSSFSRVKLKPWSYALCLCPPAFYVCLINGSIMKGTGNLGKISPL